jgi:hypothetical protein
MIAFKAPEIENPPFQENSMILNAIVNKKFNIFRRNNQQDANL